MLANPDTKISNIENFKFVPNAYHYFYPRQVQRCLSKRSMSSSA